MPDSLHRWTSVQEGLILLNTALYRQHPLFSFSHFCHIRLYIWEQTYAVAHLGMLPQFEYDSEQHVWIQPP